MKKQSQNHLWKNNDKSWKMVSKMVPGAPKWPPGAPKWDPKVPTLAKKVPKGTPKSQKNGCSKKVSARTVFIRSCIFGSAPFFEKKSLFWSILGGHFGDLFPSKMKIKINTEIGIKKTWKNMKNRYKKLSKKIKKKRRGFAICCFLIM